MATIAPGRLLDVSNAADFVALTETNFEILTAEIFKQEPTYVSGVPTTTVGPPTTGSHVPNEIWKDALGGVFKCTRAGTPGAWKQMLPAAVTSDPSSGTIPTGYRIDRTTVNVCVPIRCWDYRKAFTHARRLNYETGLWTRRSLLQGWQRLRPCQCRSWADTAAFVWMARCLATRKVMAVRDWSGVAMVLMSGGSSRRGRER